MSYGVGYSECHKGNSSGQEGEEDRGLMSSTELGDNFLDCHISDASIT